MNTVDRSTVLIFTIKIYDHISCKVERSSEIEDTNMIDNQKETSLRIPNLFDVKDKIVLISGGGSGKVLIVVSVM